MWFQHDRYGRMAVVQYVRTALERGLSVSVSWPPSAPRAFVIMVSIDGLRALECILIGESASGSIGIGCSEFQSQLQCGRYCDPHADEAVLLAKIGEPS